MVKKLFSEIYVRKYLPNIRKEISVALHEKGYSQTDIANMLGIDQTTVSNYLNSLSTSHIPMSLKAEIHRNVSKFIFKSSEERLEIFKDLVEKVKNIVKSDENIYFDI